MNQIMTSMIAGVCGGVFDLHTREKVKRIDVVMTMLIAIAMAYLAGNAVCDYFEMRYSICVFSQTMVAYLSTPILKGVKVVGNMFARNPISFIKGIKNGKNENDEQRN